MRQQDGGQAIGQWEDEAEDERLNEETKASAGAVVRFGRPFANLILFRCLVKP